MSESKIARLAVSAVNWDRRAPASTTLSGRSIIAVIAVSIVMHALLFLVLVRIVFPFTPNLSLRPQPIVRVEIIGSLDELSDGQSHAPTPQGQLAPPILATRQFVPRQFTPLSDLATAKKPTLSIIGIGAGGGDFSDFGLSIGSGEGPEFFGLGGSSRDAQRIVYVVDRSGSMTDTFRFVQTELKRSISALRRSQKFHVIFFSSGSPLENPPRRLVSAIRAHKLQFFEFLDQILPRGGTEPEPAMRRALALKPDLVYLLSDGMDFRSDLLQELEVLNKDRRVAICTIAYLDRNGSEFLERIAREHNGEFTYVSEHDLP